MICGSMNAYVGSSPFLASSKNCSSEKKLVANFLRRRDAWMASRVARLTPEEQDVLARATEILAKVAGE